MLCIYPEEPHRPQFDANGRIDPLQMEQYDVQQKFRKEDLAMYNYEDKALREVNKIINETVSARMMHQVAYAETDPWSKLVALKQRLRPSNKSVRVLA